MRYYYVIKNNWGYETSMGFANTWSVLAFSTARLADKYVAENSPKNRSIKRKTRKEARSYSNQAIYFDGDLDVFINL